jgi:hypothetical protein
MINEKQILVGPKEELLEYFCKIIEGKKYLNGNTIGNFLYTKEGFEKQLTDIIKNGCIGQIFYMVSHPVETNINSSEVNLELKNQYVHVREDILKGIK